MTANDVTAILARLDDVVQRLVRIETRTEAIADHERRIRALELSQVTSGKFTLGLIGKFVVGASGLLVVGATVASAIHGW